METKKQYQTPNIEVIVLDNEISLALESYPPVGPFETDNEMNTSDVNPFKLTV